MLLEILKDGLGLQELSRNAEIFSLVVHCTLAKLAWST